MDTMNREKIAELTDKYYSENKIHKFVDTFLKKYKWIPQKDKDDFYSIANYYFCEAANDYDGRGNFEGYLKMVLNKKLASYVRWMRRQKRCDTRTVVINGHRTQVYLTTLSFDSPIGFDENTETLGEVTPSSFNLEDNLSEEIGLSFSPDVAEYLNKLPKKTRKIALMIGDGYKPCDICEKMQIEEREYQIHMEIIHTYEYRKPMEWRYLR